jgi:hypothetical protein
MSEAQRIQSWRLSAEKSDPRNKGPNPGKTGTHMGRTIQGRQVPQKRHLSPGEVRRGHPTSSLEHRASEKVLSVRQHLCAFLG